MHPTDCRWEMKDAARRAMEDKESTEGEKGDGEEGDEQGEEASGGHDAHKERTKFRKGESGQAFSSEGGGREALLRRGVGQIFSASEATTILGNELFALMKEYEEGFDGLKAECVEDDIHTWSVRIRRDPPPRSLSHHSYSRPTRSLPMKNTSPPSTCSHSLTTSTRSSPRI